MERRGRGSGRGVVSGSEYDGKPVQNVLHTRELFHAPSIIPVGACKCGSGPRLKWTRSCLKKYYMVVLKYIIDPLRFISTKTDTRS